MGVMLRDDESKRTGIEVYLDEIEIEIEEHHAIGNWRWTGRARSGMLDA